MFELINRIFHADCEIYLIFPVQLLCDSEKMAKKFLLRLFFQETDDEEIFEVFRNSESNRKHAVFKVSWICCWKIIGFWHDIYLAL